MQVFSEIPLKHFQNVILFLNFWNNFIPSSTASWVFQIDQFIIKTVEFYESKKFNNPFMQNQRKCYYLNVAISAVQSSGILFVLALVFVLKIRVDAFPLRRNEKVFFKIVHLNLISPPFYIGLLEMKKILYLGKN